MTTKVRSCIYHDNFSGIIVKGDAQGLTVIGTRVDLYLYVQSHWLIIVLAYYLLV